MDWQPIETAPKDETVILGVCNTRGGAVIRMIYWGSDVRYGVEPRWMDVSDCEDSHGCYPDLNVSHWMPLPKLPIGVVPEPEF